MKNFSYVLKISGDNFSVEAVIIIKAMTKAIADDILEDMLNVENKVIEKVRFVGTEDL